MKLNILLIICFVAIRINLYTQNTTTNNNNVETIKVVAKREVYDPKNTTLDTSIITSEEIKAIGANNVAEVLKFSSEVIVRDSVNTQVVSIRGNRYEQTLILLNGVRQSSAQNLFHDLSQYNTANIERIEIIKGAAATRYGSGASGGVINIITKDRINDSYEDFSIETGIRYGSYNQVTADVLADIFYGEENQGNVYISGLIETNARNYQVDTETPSGYYSGKLKNNEIFKSSARIGSSYKFNDSGDILHTSFDYFHENRNSSYPDIKNSHFKYKTHKYGADISYENYSLGIFDLFFNAYTFYQTVENLGETANLHNSFDNFTTEANFSMKREDNFGNGIFVFNNQIEITYRNEYFIAGEVTKGISLDEGSEVNRNTVSVAYLPSLEFFNYENSIVRRLTITPGIRFDAIFDNFNPENGEKLNNDFYRPTYSIGIMYTFDRKRRYLIKGNFATGYRNPTFNELYLFGANSNSDLLTENIIGSGDIGFIITPINILTFESTYFISKYTDYIVYLDTGDGNYNSDNISEYATQGIDTALSLYIPLNIAYSSISLSANYTYQFMAHGLDEGSTQIFRAPFTPEHSVSAILSYMFEGDGNGIFSGGLNFLVNYTSDMFSGYDNNANLDGYYTFDITSSMTFTQYITIEGGVRNLLDTKYNVAINFPGSGREWYIAVRGKF